MGILVSTCYQHLSQFESRTLLLSSAAQVIA